MLSEHLPANNRKTESVINTEIQISAGELCEQLKVDKAGNELPTAA